MAIYSEPGMGKQVPCSRGGLSAVHRIATSTEPPEVELSSQLRGTPANNNSNHYNDDDDDDDDDDGAAYDASMIWFAAAATRERIRLVKGQGIGTDRNESLNALLYLGPRQGRFFRSTHPKSNRNDVSILCKDGGHRCAKGIVLRIRDTAAAS